MQSINLKIVPDVASAPNYRRDHPEVKLAGITQAIIVCKGTVNGNSTVDLQIELQDGTKAVVMITGHILKTIAQAIEASEQMQIAR